MSIRSGKLKCAACGSDVMVSSRAYSGMPRFVCVVPICINSEIAWDLDESNDL
jgi:hypothetical protein